MELCTLNSTKRWLIWGLTECLSWLVNDWSGRRWWKISTILLERSVDVSQRPNILERAKLSPIESRYLFETVVIHFIYLDRCKAGSSMCWLWQICSQSLCRCTVWKRILVRQRRWRFLTISYRGTVQGRTQSGFLVFWKTYKFLRTENDWTLQNPKGSQSIIYIMCDFVALGKRSYNNPAQTFDLRVLLQLPSNAQGKSVRK